MNLRPNKNPPLVVHLETGLALRQVAAQSLAPLYLHLQLPLQTQVLLPDVFLILRVVGHLLCICNVKWPQCETSATGFYLKYFEARFFLSK